MAEALPKMAERVARAGPGVSNSRVHLAMFGGDAKRYGTASTTMYGRTGRGGVGRSGIA
jgi:hypothetical protein